MKYLKALMSSMDEILRIDGDRCAASAAGRNTMKTSDQWILW